MRPVTVAALLLVAVSVTTANAAVGAGLTRRPPKADRLHHGYSFKDYTQDFAKDYTTVSKEEVTMRRALFESKLKAVLDFNDPKHGHTYRKGINHLSDRTDAERAALLGRVSSHLAPLPAEPQPFPAHLLEAASKKKKSFQIAADGAAGALTLGDAPVNLDYRARVPNVVSTVKDQGWCGSCWAFSAAAMMESHHALHTGDLHSLSVEEITACMPNPNLCGGNGGCEGSTVQLAFTYAANTGMATEWRYGYDSFFMPTPPAQCRLNSKMIRVVTPSGYVQVPKNDEASTMQALAEIGPLAISIDASDWSDYESGVFSGCNYAANITINHAVQLIGYGYDAQVRANYWLVRNSWGADWGEHGYIRLMRETTAECGWCNDWDTSGGGCKGKDPSTVVACGRCGILYDVSYPTFNVG